MPFSLTNASTSSQAYINSVLTGLLDIIYIIYIDDIMVYNEKVEEHTSHVLKVLKRLKQYSLYAKLSKYLFSIKELDFLSYIIGVADILIDIRRIIIIRD
jgi:Reverse transcriptase (RNA-dependent DNA polymerase)